VSFKGQGMGACSSSPDEVFWLGLILIINTCHRVAGSSASTASTGRVGNDLRSVSARLWVVALLGRHLLSCICQVRMGKLCSNCVSVGVSAFPARVLISRL